MHIQLKEHIWNCWFYFPIFNKQRLKYLSNAVFVFLPEHLVVKRLMYFFCPYVSVMFLSDH